MTMEGAENSEAATRRSTLSRRALIGGVGLAGVAAAGAGIVAGSRLLTPPRTLRILFTNDIHSHLRPVYHREPTDESYLKENRLEPGSVEAYTTTGISYLELARQYGKVGGLAQLATVVEKERSAMPDRTLLLDGADTWYGSGIGLLTEGRAMVEMMNAIGYDAMTLHWEFNFGQEILLQRIKEAKFAVVAQNVVDDFDQRVFEPSMVKDLGGVKVGVIGQAYPFSLLTTELRDANPGWRIGYQEDKLAEEVQRLRAKEGVLLVIVLSHMGWDQERVIAEMVPGIDLIVGGHTHDILWQPDRVGKTIIVQAGSHGKFLGELDLDIRDGKIEGFRHRLIPILADRVEPHPRVEALINDIYRPHDERLREVIGETTTVLYRRSLMGGTTDAVMADAYRKLADTEVGCCPGWRFGTTLLPGPIRVEDVYDAMKPTASPLYTVPLRARQIRAVLEDNLDNVFSPDPLQRLGGEVLRCSGVKADLRRSAPRGQRIARLTIGGAPAGDGEYRVATSGGRTQYLVPDEVLKESARPAVEELIQYVRDHSPLSAEPIQTFVDV